MPVASGLIRSSAAAASGRQLGNQKASTSAPAIPKEAMKKLGTLLEALDKRESADVAFFQTPSKDHSESPHDLSGGTPPTEYEKALINMVEAIVAETIFLYSTYIGQGDENRLSKENLDVLKENLRAWLQAFITVYGLNNLLALTEQRGQSKFDETTANEIGRLIISAANGNLDRTRLGQFMINFFSLSVQDIEESLPIGYNDNGD